MKVLILAGGLGTRLQSVVQDQPKPMADVKGKPFLEYQIERCTAPCVGLIDPAGYADVAKGNVDIYLALEEAHIENFSSLPIAWRAGAVVTDFDGHPVTFEDDIHKRYFLLCTATEALHEQVLAEIAKIDWKSHPCYREIVEEG